MRGPTDAKASQAIKRPADYCVKEESNVVDY